MKTLSTLSAIMAASAALSQNVLLIAAAGKDGETVTIGDNVLELSTLLSNVTEGRIAVDLTGSSAAASVGVLTLTGLPLADETTTIAGQAYTWKDTLTGAADEVLIGADASESIDNLVLAITAGAGAGTLYGTGTVANASVTAAAGAGDTMDVTALTPGTAGDALGTTETLTNGSFGAATLASGADATASQVIAGLVTAINGNITSGHATAITGGVLFVDSASRGPVATTETLSGSGNAWVAAQTFGQDSGGAIPNIMALIQRACTAAEATALVFVVALPAAPTAFTVQVRSSAGAIKAWDGKAVITGNAIILNSDGSTDLAENDIVAVAFAV